jgi:predicted DNA-binding helix-hairpin-helix protein
MQLADRVSVNLEAPNAMRLNCLAPHKTFFDELLTRLRWVDEIRQSQPGVRGWNGRWPSSTTQFVAGGADESDAELLQTTEHLYRNLHLKRTYFMGFTPIPDTPLENRAPTSDVRQLRLYQASFLLRDYGFSMEEMPFESDGSLPLAADPKQTWADQNLRHSPVEVNLAEKGLLLRVPGIGQRGAEAILKARRIHALRDLSMLRSLGILAERAAPYLLLDGRRVPTQMTFFT